MKNTQNEINGQLGIAEKMRDTEDTAAEPTRSEALEKDAREESQESINEQQDQLVLPSVHVIGVPAGEKPCRKVLRTSGQRGVRPGGLQLSCRPGAQAQHLQTELPSLRPWISSSLSC